MEKKIEFADLKAQYRAYKTEIDKAVLDVMASAQFIMGQEVARLEENLAKYVGVSKAVSLSSGTDALLVPLLALGIGQGDEVITTPFTFISTAEVVALTGAKPVFVDIDEKTYNIDPAKIGKKITSRTKAIIPVSLYGQVADMDEINKIAGNIPVIEDACQSFGADYKGKKSGGLSAIGATSFFPSKPLGCYGDGGAVFTDDPELGAKIESIRNHGQIKRYCHKYIGINGRLDAMQAAILNVKMKHFEAELKRRAEIGKRYTTLIKASGADVVTPEIMPDRTSVYAQYSIRVKNREKVAAYLNERGVPTAIHYPIPLHLQECYAYLGEGRGSYPVSEKVSEEIMSLPMSAFLTDNDMDYIVQCLSEATDKAK